MLISFILTFSLYALGKSDYKRHVENSAIPINNDPPNYNIESWVNQLHLQHCVIVEIGEELCALFVEFHQDAHNIQEYFFGICNIDVLLKWKYCSSILEQQRPEKCTLHIKDVYKTRVHRRLCDFSILAPFAEQCNCSLSLLGQTLNKVTGFPTCFLSPLPDSLCNSNNVCGFASCSTETVAYHIVKFECSQHCIGHDKFCQYPIRNTTIAAEISSFWSDWSEPTCVDLPCNTVISEARCINKHTGTGAIDCLGPGTSCCPVEISDCKCHLYLEGAMMKVVRTYTATQTYWQRKDVEIDWDDIDYVNNREDKNKINWKRRIELSADPYFATIYALKYKKEKDSNIRLRDITDEDIEDDDDHEDTEDNNEEDIVVEEDNDLVVTTMVSFEKGDAAQNQAENMRTDFNQALKDEIGEDMNKENGTRNSSSINLPTCAFITFFGLAILFHLQ